MSAHKVPVFSFLATDGGVKVANVNGSVTPQVFKCIPPAGHQMFLTEMHIHYGDTAVWSADEFGNIGAALANGLGVAVHLTADDSVVSDLTDGIPITTNADWGRFAIERQIDNFGSGEDFLNIRWDFVKNGTPLHISDKHYFAVTVNDDLTGLTDLTFMMHGFNIPNV